MTQKVRRTCIKSVIVGLRVGDEIDSLVHLMLLCGGGGGCCIRKRVKRVR